MGEDLILYIEGSQERAAVAYNRMAPEHRDMTIWAKNPEEAISILKDYKHRLVLVFLSNDLNEFVRGDIRREDSGAEVVRFLERQDPDTFKCGFIVQDHDKVIGKKLTNRLKAAGYRATHRPFGV